MINNKSIAVLLAGAIVAGTIIPAIEVSAAEKLETLTGSISEAKAYTGGRYVFDGYKDEDQDTKVYFFDGTKDVEIEDASKIGIKYGMNYLNFPDDEILFNLVSGQAEEDDEQTRRELLESKFKSSVMKKADRYEDTPYLVFKGKLAEDIYSGVWYQYSVQNWEDESNKGENPISYNVYINESGKYIDTSEEYNITYYRDGNKISIDNYDDLKENNLAIVFEKGLLVDKENIYKLIVLMDFENNTKTQYIQKVSMEQGDKEDDAYLPKSTTSFQAYEFDALAFAQGMENGNTARMVGNSLYTIEPNDDSITMKKYTVKKVKDKDTVEGKTLDRRALELDEDFDNIENEDMQAFDVDIYSNLWVLNKGKIQKVEDGKLVTKYEVDRTMDRLSVFDDNNLITWNTENEIYSVVSPKKVVEEKPEQSTENTEDKKEEATISTGWIKNTDGTWNYKKEDGTLATGWLEDNNSWYYLNPQGVRQNGWVKDAGTWYYLNESGVMQTGWIKDGSNWYYLNASGKMHTGWLKDTNGKWYYLSNSGAMAYNTIIDGYTLDASGAWIN